MTAPTIAVEDVTEEPEGSRVEAAVSEASTEQRPEVAILAAEVGEPPDEPTIPEPAVAKAGSATV